MQDGVEVTNEKQVADGAQLFRSFAAGLEQLDVDATDGEDIALGFDRPDSLDPDSPRDLAALTLIWKREIEARLAATTS